MNRYNVNVLAEAKKEYTAQLVNTIHPEIYVGIKSMYSAASEFCKRTNEKNVLIKFQTLLSKTPGWNQEKINNEFDRIQKNTNCDYLTDLLTAIFVSHTKVLASIKMKKKMQSFELDVPSGPHFIHKVYIECARKFWRYPYLLHGDFNNLELQRNLLQSENFIKECIEETIRKLLPVKYVLKECLGDDYNDDDDSEEDIRTTITNTTKDNIRKLIKLEIEQTLSKHSQSDDKFSKLEIKDDQSPINHQIEQLINDTNNSIKDLTQKTTEEIVAEQSSNQSDESGIHQNLDNEQQAESVDNEEDENTNELTDAKDVKNKSNSDTNKDIEQQQMNIEDVNQVGGNDDVNDEETEQTDNNEEETTHQLDENQTDISNNLEEPSTKIIKIETSEEKTSEPMTLNDNSDIKNIDLIITNMEKESEAKEPEVKEPEVKEPEAKVSTNKEIKEVKLLTDKEETDNSENKDVIKQVAQPVAKNAETKEDVISLSKLQSLEQIRNEINNDIIENNTDNTSQDSKNDEFSFFDDAANF